MDRVEYDKLVGEARAILGCTDFRSITPEEMFVGIYMKFIPESSRESVLRDLINKSKTHRATWKTVKLIAQELLRNGKALPPELAAWVADVLGGRRRLPPRGGERFGARDFMICALIDYFVQGFDMKATRNISQKRADLTKCCFEGGSAGDVVGEALNQSGENIGYKAIERIWSQHPQAPGRGTPPRFALGCCDGVTQEIAAVHFPGLRVLVNPQKQIGRAARHK